jgi:hypothetical protein
MSLKKIEMEKEKETKEEKELNRWLLCVDCQDPFLHFPNEYHIFIVEFDVTRYFDENKKQTENEKEQDKQDKHVKNLASGAICTQCLNSETRQVFGIRFYDLEYDFESRQLEFYSHPYSKHSSPIHFDPFSPETKLLNQIHHYKELSCPFSCGEENLSFESLTTHYLSCSKVNLFCNNKENGCKFRGKLKDIESHKNETCLFQFEMCNLCNEQVLRKDKETHKSTNSKFCQGYNLCPDCNQFIVTSRTDLHLLTECTVKENSRATTCFICKQRVFKAEFGHHFHSNDHYLYMNQYLNRHKAHHFWLLLIIIFILFAVVVIKRDLNLLSTSNY